MHTTFVDNVGQKNKRINHWKFSKLNKHLVIKIVTVELKKKKSDFIRSKRKNYILNSINAYNIFSSAQDILAKEYHLYRSFYICSYYIYFATTLHKK